MGLLDHSRMVVREDGYVLFPVTRPAEGFEVVEAELPERKASPKKTVKASFDIVGSIAVINDMKISEERALEIAYEILRRHKSVKTVLLKTAELSGEERVAGYRVLLGEPATETVVRESGCIFKVDLAKAFFNPRLSSERLRVASLVEPGEKVLDMFAGVGPFSIIIARRKASTTVYAVEKNPAAYSYLCYNIKANKVEDRVKPFLGDSSEIVPTLDTTFNRIIMNLPHESIKYLPIALDKAASKAVIHLYVAEDRTKPASHDFEGLEVIGVREVKEVSPRKVIRVYDLKVTSSPA